MKKILSRSFMSIIVMLIIAGGCSDDNPMTKREIALKKARERIRNAPGRTGILTEKKLYSFFDEELIIRDFFQDRQGGFFVDVGCAYPIKANNTYYLEKHLGWTGIGIDALNDYAVEWKEKRPNTRFFNFLVTENSAGSGRFYKSERMGLSSTNQNMADGFEEDPRGRAKTEEIQVKKISLTDLLDQEEIKKIDLLLLDIEGHELKALAGIDLERFSPELIVSEVFGNDKVTKYLNKHGYQQIQRYVPMDEVNTYYCRKQKHVATPSN
jgi:FkbM family methyltransferase